VTLKEDDRGILAVVGALAARGRLLRLEVGGASLEDIFVELTQKATKPGMYANFGDQQAVDSR
jgi:hypothetical protein